MGCIAEKAHEQRTGSASDYGCTQDSGKRAVVAGDGIKGQGEDYRVHQAHCKTYARKAVDSHICVFGGKGHGKEDDGQGAADPEEDLGIYELKQKKAYYAANEHTTPEPGNGRSTKGMRIKAVVTLKEEGDVVGDTLLCAHVEEDTQGEKPHLALLEKLEIRSLATGLFVCLEVDLREAADKYQNQHRNQNCSEKIIQ